MLPPLAQVALGGAAGASLRWLVAEWIVRWAGTGFPLAILGVNVLGSGLMGAFVAAAARHGWGPAAPLVAAGLLGGFTTFSAFSLDAVALIERGRFGAAALYVALSVGLSLGALALGASLVRAA